MDDKIKDAIKHVFDAIAAQSDEEFRAGLAKQQDSEIADWLSGESAKPG